MKLLLVSLLSVLAISCADFESESFGPATDAAKFEKMSGSKFEHEDASKQLYLSVTSNKSIVKIDIYNIDPDENPINVKTTTYNCGSGCLSEMASDNTYKVLSTNSNSNAVVIKTIEAEGKKLIDEQRFILVR